MGAQRVVDALIPIGFAIWVIKPVGDLWLVFLGYLLVLLGALGTAARVGVWIDRRILLSFLAAILVGVVGGAIGLLKGNPGAPSEIVFFVLLPLAWLVFTACMDATSVRRVIDILPFAGLFVGAFGVLYWMDASGRASFPWVNAIDLGQGLGAEQFGYEMRYYPISSMVFLLPFLIMSLVVPNTYTRSPSRIAAPFALLSTLTLLFVAGRRALFVALICSLAVVFVLFMLRRNAASLRNRMIVVLAVTGAVSLVIARWTQFSVFGLTSSISTGVSSPAAGSSPTGPAVNDQVRVDSAGGLIASWKTSPLFGHGLGDTITGPPRNIERPWEFEVQYHLLLNALGLVGLFVLLYITLDVLIRTTIMIRRSTNVHGHLMPVLAGSIAILIANASNPYLHTPGHYWMLFLTIVAANAALSSRRVGSTDPRPGAAGSRTARRAGDLVEE